MRSTSKVIAAAQGKWHEILTGLGGIDRELLDGRPRACPICGEGTDRFTFDDKDGCGTYICRQCPAKPGKAAGAGDGMALLMSAKGWDYPTAAQRLEQFLGLPSGAPGNGVRPASVSGARSFPAALPALLPDQITLARLPEPFPAAPPDHQPSGHVFDHGDGRTVRLVREDGGKVYYPKPTQKTAPGTWPHYHEAEAIAHAQGLWVIEAEGENCADIIRAGGAIAVSHPGHQRKRELMAERYGRLLAGGVAGVVRISDNDAHGAQESLLAAAAAADAGLPFLEVPAAAVWPEIPAKGSIDDAPGDAAERVAAIEAAAHRLLNQQLEQPEPALEVVAIEAVPDRCAATGPDGSSAAHVLDALLGPAEEGKLRRPRTDKLTQALGLILPLRYNLLTGRIEHNGHAIHGDFLGGLYLELAEEHQLEVTKDRAIDAAIRVARKNAYHPVRDYLNGIAASLPPDDWASIDVRCFGREDQTGMSGLHLQRQLIGLVARAMQPGCEFQTALVIHSDRQGIGKSSFWRILGGEWFSDSLGDLRNLKDDLLQLHAAWIHEWGEIDMVMGKQESEALKRFLSASRDDVRKPYGRGVETLQRSCGIVGTTNRRDFIKDPTGNRRFPIISIERVNLDWVTANRHAIWGSAVAAYRNGTHWQYDGGENTLVSANALAFAPEDPLRERIETWAEDHPSVMVAPLEQILKEVGLTTDDMAIRRHAGNALTSLGWTRGEKKARFDLPWGGRTNTTYGWRRPA